MSPPFKGSPSRHLFSLISKVALLKNEKTPFPTHPGIKIIMRKKETKKHKTYKKG